jgi:hypothetical protein
MLMDVLAALQVSRLRLDRIGSWTMMLNSAIVGAVSSNEVQIASGFNLSKGPVQRFSRPIKIAHNLAGGKAMMTASVNTLPPDTVATTLSKMRAFDEFDVDNDPHDERSFDVGDEKFSQDLLLLTSAWNSAAKIPAIRRKQLAS